MKIVACCPTYLRPKQLGGAIHCFTEQSHEDRKLIVLDDAGQYDDQQGDRWELHSTSERYPALGAKRNALAEMAFADPTVDAIAVMDDDDYYFPHWLEAISRGLKEAPWCVSGRVWIEPEPNTLKVKASWSHGIHHYHGSWGFTREAFQAVGGYDPTRSHGEDADIFVRLAKQYGPPAITTKTMMPYYVWMGLCHNIATTHISHLNPTKGYGSLKRKRPEKTELVIAPIRDFYTPPKK